MYNDSAFCIEFSKLEVPEQALDGITWDWCVEKISLLSCYLHAGRLVPDSPADLSGLLYMYDELLAVNNADVSKMDHADIVGLIKSSGISIQLTVQQPEDVELIVRQQMVSLCACACCDSMGSEAEPVKVVKVGKSG